MRASWFSLSSSDNEESEELEEESYSSVAESKIAEVIEIYNLYFASRKLISEAKPDISQYKPNNILSITYYSIEFLAIVLNYQKDKTN